MSGHANKKLPAYFDPLGETEPHTTLYTLTVYTPPLPLLHWLPRIFARSPLIHPITPSDDSNNPEYDGIVPEGLHKMPSQIFTIKSAWFPPDMRCEHVQNGRKSCDEGCYVLEKGGEVASRYRCTRSDCEGHAYSGQVRVDDEGKECFGKKGSRMVCLDRAGN